ncbi:hypothetical protein MCUN1_003880 [Malassezia cuniculi]|uniref:Uncharacterized protein n=1 Tax=Malassezia cuniculi TaxID=948313 RepID=A0AAF0J872_9BASI|nr:hypothetical protein MCUN1_003880 [Malassezia cuniculi]
MSIALYCAPHADADSVLGAIRATDYIKEATSGEVAPEESELWALVKSRGEAADVEAAVKAAQALPDGWSKTTCILADAQTARDQSVVLVHITAGGAETLRVAADSTLELAQRLSLGSGSISEFRQLCGEGNIYDAYGSS